MYERKNANSDYFFSIATNLQNTLSMSNLVSWSWNSTFIDRAIVLHIACMSSIRNFLIWFIDYYYADMFMLSFADNIVL